MVPNQLPPEAYSSPLLVNQIFLFLPHKLLKTIEPVISKEEIKPATWKLELALGKFADKNGSFAGLRNLKSIHCDLLHWAGTTNLEIGADLLKEMGWEKQFNENQINQALQACENVADRFRIQRRAYAGWLMTSPMFIAEQEQFCKRWQGMILTHGFPASIIANALPQIDGVSVASGAVKQFLAAAELFYRRWQLAGMSAPGLPIPHAPQLPTQLQPAHAHDAMYSFSLPRTLPVPTGETLQLWIDDAFGSHDLPHLADWMKLIRRANTGKQSIGRYARLFLLQHYWHILHHRHPKACHRRKTQLIPKFADYLQVSDETLRADLRLMSSRRG